jgi:hypothetical protein
MPPSEPVSTTSGTAVNVMPPAKAAPAVSRVIAGVQVEALDFVDPNELLLKLRLVGQGLSPVLPADWAGVTVEASHVVNDHGDIELELTLVKVAAPKPAPVPTPAELAAKAKADADAKAKADAAKAAADAAAKPNATT